jgi:hypothetical protein
MKKIILLFCVLSTYISYAQLKVGKNPKTLHSNTNFQVESEQGDQLTITRDSGNVGIGTLMPTSKLDVIGKVKITDGTQGTGKVLVSDANGQASWQNASILQTVTKDSTSASNGLILSGKEIELGGTLNKATTITTSASNTIAIGGLQRGNVSDSILVVSPSTGVVKNISPSVLSSSTEPWFSSTSKKGSISNMENIYHNGSVGIKDSNPSSTLAVNGSFSTNFNTFTSANYNVTNSDYYINYEGSSNATVNLPNGTSSNCKCKGRTYVLSNNSASSITLRPISGEKISGADSIVIDPKQNISIVNANLTSGSTWKIISFGSIVKPANTYQIYYTDANGKINTPEYLTTTYFNLANSDLTLIVPNGYSSNKVVLRWDIWGDVNTSTAASGSLRFIIEQTYNGSTVSTTGTVMMTGWSLNTNGQTRYSAPASIVLNDILPGTYVFRLQAKRDFETGTLTTLPNIYGIAAKGDVLVK